MHSLVHRSRQLVGWLVHLQISIGPRLLKFVMCSGSSLMLGFFLNLDSIILEIERETNASKICSPRSKGSDSFSQVRCASLVAVPRSED